jgi:general secretion pathway protein J
MRFRFQRRAGFTLIELLVAITVLAVLAVLGWRGLDSIVRTRIALNGDLEQTRGMQLTFAQLQSDCARIIDTRDVDNRMPTLAVEPGRLTMIRNVFADNQPTRLQVVAYRVVDGVLMRRETAATRNIGELERIWLAVMADTDNNQAVALQNNIATMSLRTWERGSNGWSGGNNAVAGQTQNPGGAPVPSNAAMIPTTPLGLEVSLQLNGGTRNLVKVFLLGAV